MKNDPFRISIGSGKCRDNTSSKPAIQQICRAVMAKVESLRARSVDELRTLSPVTVEEKAVPNKPYALTTYREDDNEGATLIVVQAYFPTLLWPTYFSLDGVGKMFAEGLLITADGQVLDAPDVLLGSYR